MIMILYSSCSSDIGIDVNVGFHHVVFIVQTHRFQVQHLQSGDAKVTMARDGQDRGIFLSPFNRKSRGPAEAAFFGNEARGFLLVNHR